jgi:hypothetical protein
MSLPETHRAARMIRGRHACGACAGNTLRKAKHAGWVRRPLRSSGLDVVAIDQVLVAQIQFAVTDDRMGPDPPA